MSVPAYQLINGAPVTTAAAAYSSSDTVIEPASWAAFPVTPLFMLLVPTTGELMKVTACNAGSPNTWTVERGMEGTVAAAIGSGDNLAYSITAAVLASLGTTYPIDEVTLGSNGPILTLTVPSGLTIPALKIRADLRTASGGGGYFRMTFNLSAGGTDYDTVYMYQPGGGGSRWVNDAGIRFWSGGATLPSYCPVEVHIHHPQSTVYHKLLFLDQTDPDPGGDYIMKIAGKWHPTTPVPITSISFFNETPGIDLLAGSHAKLIVEP